MVEPVWFSIHVPFHPVVEQTTAAQLRCGRRGEMTIASYSARRTKYPSGEIPCGLPGVGFRGGGRRSRAGGCRSGAGWRQVSRRRVWFLRGSGLDTRSGSLLSLERQGSFVDIGRKVLLPTHPHWRGP